MNKAFMVAALLCPFFAIAQDAPQPLPHKWEVGLTAGANTNMIHRNEPFGIDNLSFSRRGHSFGGYATRYLGNRWSVRGELALTQTPNILDQKYTGAALTLAPRFRAAQWLDLEAGVQVRSPKVDEMFFVASNGKVEASQTPNIVMPFVGAALHMGPVELNVRYTPGRQSSFGPVEGGWNHHFQVGLGFRLFRFDKRKVKTGKQ